MSLVPPLYSITTSLPSFRTERVHPAPSEDCYICLRPFSQKDDDNDSEEIACEAVRLLPCGHLIGSECIKLLHSKRGLDNCLICATPVARTADAAGPTMRFLLSNYIVKEEMDRALALGEHFASREQHVPPPLMYLHTAQHHATVSALSVQLLSRQLTRGEAALLWLHYLKLLLFVFSIRILFCFFPYQILGYFLARYNSYKVAEIGVNVVMSLCAKYVERQLPHYHITALVLRLMVRRAFNERVFGVGCRSFGRYVVQEVVSTLTMGIVTALLISYGLRKAKKKEE